MGVGKAYWLEVCVDVLVTSRAQPTQRGAQAGGDLPSFNRALGNDQFLSGSFSSAVKRAQSDGKPLLIVLAAPGKGDDLQRC